MTPVGLAVAALTLGLYGLLAGIVGGSVALRLWGGRE